MEQKYLPIGSVCTLKGKNKKVMVTGYYSVSFSGNLKINDYKGCAYPEGMLLPEFVCSFNHTDIEKVDFTGYRNEEQETFKGLLNRLTGNGDEVSVAEFHNDNEMFLTSNSTYSKLLFDENGVVMIADPVVEKTQEEKTGSWNNIKFDENGYVVSTGADEDINNPFHKEYKISEPKEEKNIDWKIFDRIEFDENGTVISDDNLNNKKDELLNEIKFDENGTVISVKGEDLEQEQNFEHYRFDENGTLIALGNVELEEEIPPIGPGLPGYVEPKITNYQFDENGTVIAAPTSVGPIPEGESGEAPAAPNYQFDENGTVISA